MKAPNRLKSLADPSYLLATGFGSGLSPLAPGTVGSLLALFLFLPVSLLSVWWQLLAILVVSMLGIRVAGQVSYALKVQDHPAIVIDEVAGMWLALLALPVSPLIWGLAFLLFRLLDWIKPWPIGWIDRHVKSGLGIMLDDLVAGLVVCLCMHGLIQMYPVPG